MYTITKGADIVTNGPAPVAFTMSVEGLEGTGKTYFGLMTAPTPIVYVNFGDRDATLFLYDMPPERAKDVDLVSFTPSSEQGWTRAEGSQSLAALSQIAKERLSGGALAGGTFILDSGTSWWEVVQEVYVAPEQEKREAEGGKKRGGLEYMQGNLIVDGVLRWIKAQGAFVIVTHRKTQEWGAGGPIPGKYRAQINRKIPYLVEVRLDLYKTCAVCGAEECEAKGHQGRRHWGRLLKFGRNTALEGLAIENPTFATIYKLYTGREYEIPATVA